MSVQRIELYQFSAVDIFLKLLKRRIGYYTKKVQQSEISDEAMIGPNEKFSLRLIRSKLRKREENTGIHRSNVVHPEGVLQATIVGNATTPAPGAPDFGQDKMSPLEDIFIAPVSNRKSFTNSNSDNSLSGYSSESTQLPMFLYSTGTSKNSLNSSSNDQVSVNFHYVTAKPFLRETERGFWRLVTFFLNVQGRLQREFEEDVRMTISAFLAVIFY